MAATATESQSKGLYVSVTAFYHIHVQGSLDLYLDLQDRVCTNCYHYLLDVNVCKGLR